MPPPEPIGWVFHPAQGAVESAPASCWCHPPRPPAPRMSGPFIATNYTAYQDCNLWKRPWPSRFRACSCLAQLQAGAWRRRPCGFLADCWPAPSKPCATSSIFDAKQRTGLPTTAAAPDPDLRDLATAGGSCLLRPPSGSRRWRRPGDGPNGCSWKLGASDTGDVQRKFGRLAGSNRAPTSDCPALERGVLPDRCRERHAGC